LRENELVDLTRRLERTNDKLRRLSVLDELTGIPNRRYFNLLLQQEWGRAAREKQPLSLVMIDVDHFKSFNDLYGHPAGDACLTRVARTLFSLIRRTSDSVCRFGGEEFVALLANTDLAGASVVAEGFRKAVEEVARAHLGSPHQHVTVSLGVACTVPEVEGASDDLLHAADEALYRAKATGRNRVEVADELAAAAADSTVV
jgi:diguanylate cyclase (GGDEF)-like protein